MDEQPVTFGWYGKSPGTGDFVSRRLARPLIDELDRWFQTGMTALRERAPDGWQAHYAKAPVWNGLLPAGIVAPQACLVTVGPSSDRVGRRFPFCVVASLPKQSNGWLRSLAQSGEELSRLVDRSRRMPLAAEDLDRGLHDIASRNFAEATPRGGDDIASVLEDLAIDSDDLATVPLGTQSAFPWPDLAQRFEADGKASYWWTAGSRQAAGFVHRGRLDADLFVTLFGAACPPN